MNFFVHGVLGHYLQQANLDDGSDAPSLDDLHPVDQSNDHQDDQDDQQQDDQQDQNQGDDDEVVIGFADEQEQIQQQEEETKAAPQWVRDLRKRDRENAKRIRELEAQLQQSQPAKPKIELGKKPSLDDFDYDTEKFEGALTEWFDRKRQIEAQAESEKFEQEERERAWNDRLKDYEVKKAALRVPDYEEAEESIKAVFDQVQQGIMVNAAENAAHLVYALGKSPSKMQELASIKDPIKFTYALAKLEGQIKVGSKKTTSAPPPETRVRGSAPIAGSVDSNLERLRAEAEKTGDYSKVTAYRRQQREKQRQ